jgi:hypothetical protein
MTGNEGIREKQSNIVTNSNAMFKLFPRSSVSEIFVRPHVGGSSGRDKNGAGDGIRDRRQPVLVIVPGLYRTGI